MNKTKIEWCDYTWNPIKGYCPNDCPYCYAHRMYNRWGWDKTIRIDVKELNAPMKLKKPSRIFVGSMIEMYHIDIIGKHTDWIDSILAWSCQTPQHTFITLSKCSGNYDFFNFPENWWLGVSLTGQCRWESLQEIRPIVNNIKFVSIEPLLVPATHIDLDNFDWIIIGGLTPAPVHKKEWIDDIVGRADELGIPIFIKDNAHYPIKRQEFPK